MAKKLYYKIGEACKKLDIQPYVLRYWETEFAALSPNKSKSGQRVYSEKDLEIIWRIKELLYEEGFTIAGAKKKLEGELKTGLKPLHKPGDRQPASEPESDQEDEAAAETAGVDSTAGEQIEMLRKGIEAALGEARDILALLGSEKTKQKKK